MTSNNWTHTAFAGPGHARHALDRAAGAMACGAHRRKHSGRPVIVNHEQPFSDDDVTCARCRKALGLRPRA